MEKRYQVFISSTYKDLVEERSKVMNAVMRMNHIPSGMELFSAVDEEQFEYIKREIDVSDYYLIIVGGRYGSLSEDGLSYTEKEYDYAVSKGIKAIALLHKHPEDIKVAKTDMSEDLQNKLKEFRTKIETGKKVVAYWTNADELAKEATLALTKTISLFPSIGWIRANTIANPELLQELNEVRKELDLLRIENEKFEKEHNEQNLLKNLYWLDSNICLSGVWSKWREDGQEEFDVDEIFEWEVKYKWSDLLLELLPYLVEPRHNWEVSQRIKDIVAQYTGATPNEYYVDRDYKLSDTIFDSIKIRLMGEELISFSSKTEPDTIKARLSKSPTISTIEYQMWNLTTLGAKLYIQLQNSRITE